MTEAEWLASAKRNEFPESVEFHELLNWLCSHRMPTPRKLRLFATACCRRIWHLMLPCDRDCVLIAEKWADASATYREMRQNIESAGRVPNANPFAMHAAVAAAAGDWENVPDPAFYAAHHSANCASNAVTWGLPGGSASNVGVPSPSEAATQAKILHELFGNPFRPVVFDPTWQTTTAVTIAHTMYDSRDFSPMPLLADALQDAGCGNEDILNHCRSGGPHVRGCWVVDLILGKE